MKFAYNVDFELASMFFIIIMLVYIIHKYPKKSGQSNLFRWVAFAMIATELTDIISAIVLAYNSLPAWLGTVTSTAYFMMGIILSYLLLQYIYKYVIPKDGKTYFESPAMIIFTLTMASYITNIPGKYYFYIDEAGNYVHGPVYIAVYALPIFLSLLAGFNIFMNRKVLGIIQFFSTGSYVVLILLGAIIQAVFTPDIMLFLYTSSLALLIIFFSLETPDYQLLSKTLEELQDSKQNVERLYEKANQANKAKSDFLSHMSHEIRTPINAIMGLNEMILRESDDDVILGYASDSKGAIATLHSIINDILDFSKIESGKLEIIPVPYYFESVIHDIKNMTMELCARKNLKLIFEIDPNIPSKMLGDETRIKQIFLNLLTNAVKYTKEGYVKFTITSSTIKEKVVLTCTVTDTGMGISKENIEKLFMPFERLDHIKNRNVEGTGLGLAITTQLLNNMDSELKVESEYGKGSSFSFALEQKILDFTPIGARNWLARQNDNKSEYHMSFTAQDAHILLVDDNALNRKVVASLLKESHMTIDEAGDGEECIHMVEKHNYDLIFLDHMMPNMDGVETLHAMRDRNMCDNTPIIALTANAVVGMREYYLNEGFSDFLTKPVFSKNLEKMLLKWLPSGLIERTSSDNGNAAENKQIPPKDKETPASLPDIDGILWDYGKLFLPMDILITTALDYYETLNTTKEHIASLYKKINGAEGLLQYQTAVHSFKSTSAMIGATQVSAIARLLEKSSKEKNLNTIHALHPILIEEMTLLNSRMSVLDEYIGGNKEKGSAKIQKLETIEPSLVTLRDSLEQFDYDTADLLMEQISENTYDKASEYIEQLKEQVMNLQATPAIETINKILDAI